MNGGCIALWALRTLLDERGLFFDRMGVLNSDGRRLAARAARAEARRGSERASRILWEFLRDPTLDEALRLLPILEEMCPGGPRAP